MYVCVCVEGGVVRAPSSLRRPASLDNERPLTNSLTPPLRALNDKLTPGRFSTGPAYGCRGAAVEADCELIYVDSTDVREARILSAAWKTADPQIPVIIFLPSTMSKTL